MRGLVLEHLEPVAVVAIDAVLGGKPEEAQIVLDDLRYAALRQAFIRGELQEPNIIALDHARSDYVRINQRLRRAAVGRRASPRGRQATEQHHEREGSAKNVSHARHPSSPVGGSSLGVIEPQLPRHVSAPADPGIAGS